MLETRFTTVRWDMPGHGRSAKPTGAQDYSLAGVLRDLETVMDATTGNVVLIGHSLGGYLAQYRAVGNMDRVRALVLIATGPGFRSAEKRDAWNTYVRRSAESFEVPAAAVGLAEQHDESVMANLEKLTVPVLQIAGERDTQYHGALEVLKGRVPDIETMIVPGAGHHVHRSHSAVVGNRILSFLERVS
jgi:pimeloyl-ACP methyl ester carboxylesterase